MKRMMITAVTAVLLIILSGCSLPGKVYVSFYWFEDTAIPDLLFAHTMGTTVPGDINVIEDQMGAYYPVTPGDYAITCRYSSGQNYTGVPLPLHADSALLGVQNTYYDIILLLNPGPELHKVPEAY